MSVKQGGRGDMRPHALTRGRELGSHSYRRMGQRGGHPRWQERDFQGLEGCWEEQRVQSRREVAELADTPCVHVWKRTVTLSLDN